MNAANSLQAIEDFVNELTARSENIFPVEIKISPLNEIKIFLDADDGITIQKCTEVNKALYNFIEAERIFPDGNFSLEVSSPGVDEPLKLYRQFIKNTGRMVEIILNDGSKKEGILTKVSGEEISIQEKTGKGNKIIIKTSTILFNQIKQTKVLIIF